LPRAQLFFILGVQVVVRLRALILIPLLFRGLGPDAYGRWVLVLAAATLAVIACSGNLQIGVLRRFGSASRIQGRELYWTANALAGAAALMVAAGLIAAAPLLSRSVGGGDHDAKLVRTLGFLVVTGVVLISAANGFRARGAFRRYALIMAFPRLFELAAAGLAVLMDAGLLAALQLLALGEGFMGAVCLIAVTRSIPPTLPRWHTLRALLAFSLPTLSATLGEYAIRVADRGIIGFFLGAQAVGIYNAAYALASLPFFLMQPVRVVLLRSLSPIWDRAEQERVEAIVGLALKVTLALALPICVGVALVGRDVLVLLTGTDAAGWTSFLLLTIGLGNVCYGVFVFGSHNLMLLERTKVAGVAVCIGVFVNVISNTVLVPGLGLLGAGIATLVAYALVAAWCLAAAAPGLKPRLNFADLGRVALGLGAMSAIVTLVGGEDPARLAVAVASGGAVYMATILAAGLFSPEDQGAFFRRTPDGPRD
jgi:O-antigen/teichoic acid export membrane protein